MKGILFCLVVFAACSKGTTNPGGIDPSILVTNLSDDTATVTWVGDAGTQTVQVPPRTANVCTRWTQSFDSLYTRVAAGQNASVTSPWLHFSEYPYYFQVDTVFGSQAVGGTATGIANHIAATEC